MCSQVLPGPEVALKAAASATGKKRQEVDEIVQRAVTDASHLLNLLKLCLPLLTGAPSLAMPLSLTYNNNQSMTLLLILDRASLVQDFMRGLDWTFQRPLALPELYLRMKLLSDIQLCVNCRHSGSTDCRDAAKTLRAATSATCSTS